MISPTHFAKQFAQHFWAFLETLQNILFVSFCFFLCEVPCLDGLSSPFTELSRAKQSSMRLPPLERQALQRFCFSLNNLKKPSQGLENVWKCLRVEIDWADSVCSHEHILPTMYLQCFEGLLKPFPLPCFFFFFYRANYFANGFELLTAKNWNRRKFTKLNQLGLSNQRPNSFAFQKDGRWSAPVSRESQANSRTLGPITCSGPKGPKQKT